MKMSSCAAQRRILTLTVGGLGGILTNIETVEEIAAMPKYPTDYPTSEIVKRLGAVRHQACFGPWDDFKALVVSVACDAAAAIAAQAARIAELEKALDVAEAKTGDDDHGH